MPFREPLVADADLAHFDPARYFAGSKVRDHRGEEHLLVKAIPSISGQIVLEGESGQGKSLFARRLTGLSQRIAIFLPARRCDNGVLEAIQFRLQGVARDETFLRQLVYLGAVDLVIDGVNEVSPETRARITDFVEANSRANILLTTQPMEWRAPATARRFKILPLERASIEDFLVSREPELPDEAICTGERFKQKARQFLARSFDVLNSTPEREDLQKILSNPMDLTTAALLISFGAEPDLMALQQQSYEMMARDYADTNQGAAFPLADFSEYVYVMRNEDRKSIPEGPFADAVATMERHKMLLKRFDKDKDGKSITVWRFRHDKIMEFFLYNAMRNRNYPDRPKAHIGDPRFRGAYLLMAQRLPLEGAEALRELVIQHGADTGDHSLSDEFVKLLRARKAGLVAAAD